MRSQERRIVDELEHEEEKEVEGGYIGKLAALRSF